jgi:endonuclease YncB( thermonuclease family)
VVFRNVGEKRDMRKPDGLAAALVLIGLVAAAAYLADDQEVVAGFAEVVDGDSIRLDGRVIRISGVDAPELRQTCLVHSRPYACGDVAKRALDDMVAGRLVTCRVSSRDRYGRRLASCEAGGEDVGAGLVSRGFAVAYGRYQGEEADARRKKLELWSGSFERPSEWRKAHPDHGRS